MKSPWCEIMRAISARASQTLHVRLARRSHGQPNTATVRRMPIVPLTLTFQPYTSSSLTCGDSLANAVASSTNDKAPGKQMSANLADWLM